MAVGGSILGLGFALILGGPSVANVVYGTDSVGLSAAISISDAFSISFWFLWAGFVMSPVGLAVLAYGVGARESSPKTISPETGT
jgi:hypothetical protein